VSIDQGKTWKEPESPGETLDLTDLVKGSHQYFLRFEAPASALADKGVSIRTVCQCGQGIVPRLHDGDNLITYCATGHGFASAGPNLAQAEAHVVDGKIGSPSVTLQISTPRKEKAVHLYAMAHVASGNPPKDSVTYQIEFSTDAGKTWAPVVKDWKILRRGVEPDDFWSQSMCYGDVPLESVDGPVLVRFSNSANKVYQRAEAHLVYQTASHAPVDVTIAWKEGGGEIKTAAKTYDIKPGEEDATWKIPAGKSVETQWVEYSVK
jgi:hypothetical protein